jgi:hypothetical protein
MTRMQLCLAWLLCAACRSDEHGRSDVPIDQGEDPAATDSAAEGGSDAGARAEDAATPRTPDAGSGDAGESPRDAGHNSDAGEPPSCPPLHERTIVDVPAGVLSRELSHWTCDHMYELHGIVMVYAEDALAPAVLTIDPGTMVMGGVGISTRGFLVITRNGRIEAHGTARAPIVFTSANPAGSRDRDDWGGITLLGAASTGGMRRVEGFPATVGGNNIDAYLAYGPRQEASEADAQVPMADDAHDCGTLRYVRIEFASFNAGGGMGNESNALQTYACGWNTEIDYVQSHRSGDDGVEVFGGTNDFRHLVITGASDDSFDWDDGWRGRAQFVVAQQYGDSADLGFEGGGSGDMPGVAPSPRLFNMTWIGSNGAPQGKVGGRLRGGSLGTLQNHIFIGFNGGALDIGGSTAAQNFRAGHLTIRNSVFHRASANSEFPVASDDTADDANPDPAVNDSIDEAVELTSEGQHNRVVDPQLPAPFAVENPLWVPLASAPLGADHAALPSEAPGELRPAFFDTGASYVGAFAPGGPNWAEGWTAFPER